MTMTGTDVNWDMYDRDIYASPYETFRRLRNDAPVYYNEKLNFYALSRHEDLVRVLPDRETFISGKGMSFNVISKDLQMPPGLFINEDAPMHTMHRSIVSRLFTPAWSAGSSRRSARSARRSSTVWWAATPSTSCATSPCSSLCR